MGFRTAFIHGFRTDCTKNAHYVCSLFHKCPHVSKKAINAHASVRGTMLEDIFGKTCVTIHDDTKHSISHSKRTFKTLQLGPILWVHSTKKCYRPMHINKYSMCLLSMAMQNRRNDIRLTLLSPNRLPLFHHSDFLRSFSRRKSTCSKTEGFLSRFSRYILLLWSLFGRERAQKSTSL